MITPKKIRALIVALAGLCTGIATAAAPENCSASCCDRAFEASFADSTIRLDYILGGTATAPTVSLLKTSSMPTWSGRRHNLDKLPLAGNNQLTVTSTAGDTLYRTSFSSLYNEWLALNDTVARAFEHSLLIPRPKQPVNVTLEVFNARRECVATHRFGLDPADVLIRSLRPAGYDTVMIHQGSYQGTKIRFVFLSEGFRADQMDEFHAYARRAVDAIFRHEPFGDLRERFDFVAVDVPSADSDVSHPADGVWRSTAFGSHFSTFYSARYLTVPNVFAMHDALVGIPYDHIVVLANTDTYGGGGIYNDYTITNTGNPNFEPVVVHEIGHSFGGLGDEYFYEQDVMNDTYPLDVEPWEPNITTLVDFASKWEGMMKPGTPVPTPTDRADEFAVGLYEGGGYSTHGVYRPADYCRMRINDIDHFCPVCVAALRSLIIFYTE